MIESKKVSGNKTQIVNNNHNSNTPLINRECTLTMHPGHPAVGLLSINKEMEVLEAHFLLCF